MGGWLSKPWLPWGSEQKQQQSENFSNLATHGYFNLTVAPTLEEDSDSDDEDSRSSPTLYLGNEDEDDEGLIQGRELRTSPRDWVYDESRSALESRRPVFYRSLFRW
jgi:hypothetical protein